MASSPKVMVLRLEFGSRAMPNLLHSHRKRTRGALRPLLSAAVILDPAIEAAHAQNAARGAAGFFYRLMIEEMIANEDWRKSLFLHSAK
jgi:hypothetical protein